MRGTIFTGMEEFKPKVHISEKFMQVVRKLDRQISTEFSVLGKATINGDVYEVGDEYYIPEQEVTSSSVDYEEDMYKLREQGWNVAVHKHPSGVKHFSSADYEYLNNQFDLSLLWVDGAFNDATVRIVLGDKYIVIDVEKENIMIGKEEDIQIEGVDKIKQRSYYYYKKYQSKYWSDTKDDDKVEVKHAVLDDYDDEYWEKLYRKYQHMYG